MARRASSTYGFKRTYGLLETRIRKAGESRGFAVSRLLTHWDEVAGPDIAGMARPVEVKYGRGAMGATLVLLTTGAHAPVLEMEKERLRQKVNGVYGYNAIARIRVTQTAPTGFSEGQVSFARRPASPPPPAPEDPALVERARDVADGVEDGSLRAALELLARNVLKTPRT